MCGMSDSCLKVEGGSEVTCPQVTCTDLVHKRPQTHTAYVLSTKPAVTLTVYDF